MRNLLLCLIGLSMGSLAYGAGLWPQTVKDFDLTSYFGRWYEVASTKPKVQEDCVCVTADYIFQTDDFIEVINSCRRQSPDSALELTRGSVKTTRDPAKLKVSFGGFQFPISNYWIVDIADNYRYAVVSTFLRSPIWILSREPEIAPQDLEDIYARLEKDGFDTSKISPTLQAGCPATWVEPSLGAE